MVELKPNDRPKVIAGIPAFNEEKYIGTIVLETRQYVDEVIVVDDGSTDKTADVARLAGANVIQHTQNRGYGASIQTILAEVKKGESEILVILDADFQHNPAEIPQLVEHISEGIDLIIGSRRRQGGNIPKYRRIGQRIISAFSRMLSGENVFDSESGFRVFSQKAIATLQLKERGMAISAETIAEAAKNGLKIMESPISIRYTADGSTMNPVVHGVGVLTRIVFMISERKPLVFFGLSGILLAGLGIAAGMRVIDIANSGEGVALGTALVSILLIISGMLTLFTGMILHALSRGIKELTSKDERN